MSVAILSAKTGNGHNAVMNAIAEELRQLGQQDVLTLAAFYEDLMVSNRVVSDFYNFLLLASTEMAAKFVEFAALKGPIYHDLSYAESREHLLALVHVDGLRAIISTTPVVNRNVIRVLDEEGLTEQIPFYVVVTDPFDPIAPGFADRGATRYFCPTDVVRSILERGGVAPDAIEVTGYAVSSRFLASRLLTETGTIRTRLGFSPGKQTLLLNAGAAGAPHYLKFLEVAAGLSDRLQTVLLCGRNRFLLKEAERLIDRRGLTSLKALPFIDDVETLLAVADIVVTKPGASAFFECINAGRPMILDGVTGFLFQERGVIKFLEKHPVAVVLDDVASLGEQLEAALVSGVWLRVAREAISALGPTRGAEMIARRIVDDLTLREVELLNDEPRAIINTTDRAD